MLEIKFNTRTFVKTATGQVAVRVMWEGKREVVFGTGVWAEQKKWDADRQKAKKMTTHNVKKHSFTSTEINDRIALYLEEIEHAFYMYSLKGSIPEQTDIKRMVNAAVGKSNEEKDAPLKVKTLAELFNDFITKGTREKNWDDLCREKYTQAFQHFTAANPRVKTDKIDVECMFRLRDWYVKEEYVNRTINKQFIMLKAFLKYLNDQEGITIPNNVLSFETNFKVVKRVVTFMHYDELQKFTDFHFVHHTDSYSRARDLWCFMAYTSLRYSDLARLKPYHIIDGKRIELIAEKTDEPLSIPLTEGALKIIARRGGCYGKEGTLFDVMSNAKLNSVIKGAAKEAGLTRQIVDVYFIGTKRYEKAHKFCDIIGCHDARRTFVSCSLAMGIPPQVVMKCTGHTGYATMKPYIDTATETQAVEMEKWNRNQYKSQIISILDKAKESELEKLLDIATKLIILKEDIRIAKPEIEDANDPKVIEKKAEEKFLIKNAMEKGQLIHLYYDKVDIDPVDLAIIEGRATTIDGLGYEVEMMV